MQDLRHKADGSQQRALATQSRLQSELSALANESAAARMPSTPNSSRLAAHFADDGLDEVQLTSDHDNEESWNVAKGVQKLLLSSQNLREQLENTEIELESQRAELSRAKKQVARLRTALTRA